MNKLIIPNMVALLFLASPAPVQAVTMSSPNYSSSGGFTSGGNSATDPSGMAKAGIAIGQTVYLPAAPPTNQGYSAKATVLASPDNSGTPLQVSTLPDGAVTASSPLVISGTVGTTPLPASVTVNGMPVSVNPDGSFSISLPLSSGSNTVTIRVTARNGVVTTRSRTVAYDPGAAPVTITSVAANSSVPTSQTIVPLNGSVGENVTSVTVSTNGGAPVTVPVANGSFSGLSGTLAAGLNTIVVTTSSGTSSTLTVWRSDSGSLLAHTGDINGDGRVDIFDALLALRSGVGLVQLASNEVSRGDVSPLRSGVALGDGRIDIEDAVLILRKAVGLAW